MSESARTFYVLRVVHDRGLRQFRGRPFLRWTTVEEMPMEIGPYFDGWKPVRNLLSATRYGSYSEAVDAWKKEPMITPVSVYRLDMQATEEGHLDGLTYPTKATP